MKRIGKFEMYQDPSGEWRWRLRASNGRIIATSGEGYTNRAACEGGIRSLKWNAILAPIKLEQ